MSRWFRHYAGMMRDDKLVRAALRTKQPIERVVWVWGAILESAAEIDDAGRYDIDAGEIAYFLHADGVGIPDIIAAFDADGLTAEGCVAEWSKYSRHCIRLPWSTWATIRLSVFQRDNYACRYCGASGVPLDCDHVIPLSRGGTNDKTNLVAACKPCNCSKGDKLVSEWRPEQ